MLLLLIANMIAERPRTDCNTLGDIKIHERANGTHGRTHMYVCLRNLLQLSMS
jgi:hypothetical protein